MTKREKHARIKHVQQEFMARLKSRFPLVEYMDTEELPTGRVLIHVYAPYEDILEIIEAVSDLKVALLDEGLFVGVVPHSQRIEKPAELPAA